MIQDKSKKYWSVDKDGNVFVRYVKYSNYRLSTLTQSFFGLKSNLKS